MEQRSSRSSRGTNRRDPFATRYNVQRTPVKGGAASPATRSRTPMTVVSNERKGGQVKLISHHNQVTKDNRRAPVVTRVYEHHDPDPAAQAKKRRLHDAQTPTKSHKRAIEATILKTSGPERSSSEKRGERSNGAAQPSQNPSQGPVVDNRKATRSSPRLKATSSSDALQRPSVEAVAVRQKVKAKRPANQEDKADWWLDWIKEEEIKNAGATDPCPREVHAKSEARSTSVEKAKKQTVGSKKRPRTEPNTRDTALAEAQGVRVQWDEDHCEQTAKRPSKKSRSSKSGPAPANAVSSHAGAVRFVTSEAQFEWNPEQAKDSEEPAQAPSWTSDRYSRRKERHREKKDRIGETKRWIDNQIHVNCRPRSI